MITATLIGDVLFFGAGLAVGVIFKDPVLKWWKGAEAFAQSLKDKADKIKGAL